MRLPLASRTNKRPSTVLVPGGRLDLAAFNSDILALLFIVHRRKRGRDQTHSADTFSAQGDSSHSVRNRYRARSATVTITRPCAVQNRTRSGTRAMVPSSFTISQITPAGH